MHKIISTIGSLTVIVAICFPDAFKNAMEENLTDKKVIKQITYEECTPAIAQNNQKQTGLSYFLIPLMDNINKIKKEYDRTYKKDTIVNNTNNDDCIDSKVKSSLGYGNYSKQN